MDQRLRDAAQKGSIDALYALIQRDAKVLDRIDEIPFIDTPLHDAAYAGHTRFAMEIMRLKPSFIRKLNQNGFTPVHLALQNDQTQLLHRLLDVDDHLVRVQGREGMTPLHYVAQTGNLHLLAEFRKVCPMSIKDVTIRGETALHIALKNNQLDAFELLIRWLQHTMFEDDSSSLWEKKLLNWKDEEGKSVLYIAAEKTLPQVVGWLLNAEVDINATNLDGFTALDMLEGQVQIDNREIKVMLCSVGALCASSLPRNTENNAADLRAAAQQGSIDALYRLIHSDANVLDRIDDIPFVETPLHTAASAGHTQFAMEIVRLKPSFARKLNQDGLSPMHLALQNSQTQVVHQLLDVDEDLVRVQGREGVTSLHYVAQTENLNLLAQFLKACPKSIEDVTIQKETVLHVALKHNKFDAFCLLLGWLRRTWFRSAALWEKKLNWQDEEGNTVLHIAVSKNQTQIVRLLLNSFHHKVDTNVRNSGDLRALEMLQGDNQQIQDMLRYRTRSSSSSNFHLSSVESLVHYLKSPVKFDEKLYIFYLRQRTKITNDTRNILLVVAALLVTITFQTIVNPPGGVWQDNYFPTSNTSNSIAPTTNGSEDSPLASPLHFVGTTNMNDAAFIVLSFLNIVSFGSLVLTIFLLLPGGFISGLFSFPLYVLSLCFIISLLITSPIALDEIGSRSELYFYIFSFLCPVVTLEGIVKLRQRKLLRAFLPTVKVLDPTLT